jgi:hypothetical protein
MALAVLTRWAYALVAVPVAALAAWRLVGLVRHRPVAAAAQAGAALLVAAVVLAPVLRGGVLPTHEGGADFAGSLSVYSWNPANALRREFVSTDGRLQYRLPNGLYYALLPAHPFYFTPLLAIFILPGVWTLRRRATARGGGQGPRLALLLLGWPAMIWGFHAGAPWQNFRFGLAMLPPLAIVAAMGMEWAAKQAWGGEGAFTAERAQHAETAEGMVQAAGAKRKAEAGRWLSGGMVAVLAGGLVWMVVGGIELTRSLVARKNDELKVVAAVEAAAPEGAQLLTFNLTSTFEHYSRLETHELYYLTPSDLAAIISGETRTFVVLNVENVERQWQGRTPAENFHWLRDNRGLDRLAEYPPYTLFEVR